ncbi:MAG TPA: tetratricopeptide repeat protein [Flavipsychrobacter sp.]|nr:tetratricopeptide repeat protein [Flavipsychrobacter sp.]
MRAVFPILILLFSTSVFAEAGIPYNQWWTKANIFYNQKSFDSAAVYYERIAAQTPENPELYYNLGNTYYRLNKIPHSILYYKRALRLDPNYTEAKDNLELAQSRLSKKTAPSRDIFFISWWKQATSPGLAGFWAMATLFVFLFWLGLSFLKRWKQMNFHPGVFYTTGILFFSLLLIAFASAQNKNAHDEAVVMQPDALFKTTLKNGKSEMVAEGTIVKWNEKQGQYVSVQLPDGRSGWIDAGVLERI